VPIDYTVDHARRRIFCLWIPPVEDHEIVTVIERAAADGVWKYGTIHDVRSIEPRGIARAREMAEVVARLRETHGTRGPVAFVASAAAVGSAQAYAILGDQAGQATQVFWDRGEADAWLDRRTPKA
jgi:hypothetical protein